MNQVTFLGPVGATFSHDAYNVLAREFDAPRALTEPENGNCIPASGNRDILRLVLEHGGYGAIAMETLAEGRVAEPLETFMSLLKTYGTEAPCPIHVAGAVRMRLRFCLMAKHGTGVGSLKTILAHPKAFGACKKNVTLLGVREQDAASNGEAARLVSESKEEGLAAIGPLSAAKKYDLEVLNDTFEDKEAFTTFFLVAPTAHAAATGKENRVLIVYKVPHKPNALVTSLLPFGQEGLNLIQIHSIHAGNATYIFAIEIEVKDHELGAFDRALAKFKECASDHLVFGPFQVLSR